MVGKLMTKLNNLLFVIFYHIFVFAHILSLFEFKIFNFIKIEKVKNVIFKNMN